VPLSRLVPAGYQAPARLNYRYLDDEILLDEEGAYTVVSIPTRTWTLLSGLDRRTVLARTVSALSNLPRGGAHLTRLITTTFPLDATAWQEQLLRHASARGHLAPGFVPYLSDVGGALNRMGWPLKRVYLVVRIGDRARWDGPLGRARRAWTRLRTQLELGDEMPPAEELAFWRDVAANLRATLAASFLDAAGCGAAETELLLLRMTHPGLPVPDTYATTPTRYCPGELRQLCGGEVRVEDLGRIDKWRYRCLRHDTMMGTSYQTQLVLSQTPEELPFPNIMWLDLASQLPFETTQSVGFEIEEASTTRKDADKALRHLDEQFYTDADAGVSTDLTFHDKAELARQMKYLVQHHRVPFTRFRALTGIADTDKEVLRDKVREAIRFYRENAGITMDAPPSNQRMFFYESLPAGVSLDADYRRRVSLDYLAAGMPHLSPSLGDSEGPYQGFTLTDAGVPGEPVFLDHLLYATKDGIAPTEAICGEPGGGKTVSRGLKPVWEDCLRGVTQAIWDPKGDYLPIVYNARKLGLDPGRVHAINMLDAETGMLDPAALAETPEERGPLMREVLFRLAPDLFLPQAQNASVFGDVVRQAVQTALDQHPEGACLTDVVEVLASWEHLPAIDDINQDNKRRSAGPLARRYRGMAEHPMGRLIFAKSSTPFRVPAGHLILFSTLGMRVPDPGTPPERMTETELLSDVIFGLMADYTWNLMARLPVELPKAITWDEWHINKDNPRAQVLVDRVQRLGRARNTFLRLISQSAADFPSGFITAVFAFGVRSRAEAARTCELLGVSDTKENLQLVLDLVGSKGRCIVRDKTGRLAVTQIEFVYGWVLDLFDTNPEKDPERMQRIVSELFGSDAAAARAKVDAATRELRSATATAMVDTVPDDAAPPALPRPAPAQGRAEAVAGRK
jgi:hypothetical protein